jgi:hypothetical protein
MQELPDNLLDMTYLREWHIRRTKICKLPEWIVQFPDLCVLDIPQNGIDKLPVEIGNYYVSCMSSYLKI